MAKNTVIYDVGANTKELVEGAKKGKKAFTELGNSAKKSGRDIKTIAGAVNQQKRVVRELQYQYYKLSDAEKAAHGAKMQAEIQSHIGKLNQLKAAQAQMTNQINGATSAFSKFGNSLSMAGAQMGLPIGNLSALMTPTTAAIAGVAALGTAFVATAKKTDEFNVALNNLSVRLNVSSKDLKQFADDAIDMGNKFGVSANSIVEQFQFISQQAPGIEKDRKGLLALSDAANTLAVDFGVDVKDATNSVMTVMSKFNLQASEATDVSNVLAESCRNTGADLEYQRTVFEKVGSAAHASGISYQELASATGVLSSTFSDASVVGSGLNTMISKLQKAQDKYNPSVVGLSQAIKNMNDDNLSYADITSLVGTRAAQVTQVLMDQQNAYDDLSNKMKDTNAAQEMFGVKSKELGFWINKIKAAWSNFLIKLGESEIFQTIMGLIKDICEWVGKLSDEIQELLSEGDGVTGFTKLWETLREVINLILPVIGAVIKIFMQFYNRVYTIVSDIIKFWVNLIKKIVNAAKTLWNNIKEIWDAIYKKIADNAIFKGIVKAYQWLADKITKILQWAAEKWNDFVGWLGFDSLKIKMDTSGKPSADDAPSTGGGTTINPKETEVDTDTSLGGGKGGGKGSRGTNKSSNTYDKESEEYYNQLIREREELLKKQNLTQEQTAKILREIVDYEQKRDDIKRRMDKTKSMIELESRISPETMNMLKDKFKQRLPMYIDLFKDAKTDADVKKIVDEYNSRRESGNISDIVKIPAKLDVQLKTPDEIINDNLRSAYERGTQMLSDLQDDYSKGIIDKDKFLQQFDIIKKALEEMGLTVDIHPELKKSEMQQTVDDAAGVLNNLGNAIGAIANATQDEGLNAAAVIAQAIANIWLGFSDALAKDKTTKQSIFAFLGASLAGVATMIGVISQINANRYAEGGIIQGSSTMGDKILARVNAGEMVLNRRQQTNLFNALDHNRLSGDAPMTTSTVKVKGSDLYLSLKNYNKSKSGKDIGIK